MEYNEFEEWDRDNSSARVMIAFNRSIQNELEPDDLLNEYGLELYEDGELQSYMYSDNITQLTNIEGRIYQLESRNIEELIKVLDDFNFDHLWHFDNEQMNFVSDWNWKDNTELIQKVLEKTDALYIAEVCVVSD